MPERTYAGKDVDDTSDVALLKQLTCWNTVKVMALATLDAMCCLPCCLCCGGCCGRYAPFLAHINVPGSSKPVFGVTEAGVERCKATCSVQTYAALLMGSSCCGCFWCCCGLGAPCAKAAVECMLQVEAEKNGGNTHANQTTPGAK